MAKFHCLLITLLIKAFWYLSHRLYREMVKIYILGLRTDTLKLWDGSEKLCFEYIYVIE